MRLAALLLGGCAGVDYRPVDLQLDVLGAVPAEAETIRMCVEGVGELTEGAGNGRVVYAGLRTDSVAQVTLSFETETGDVIGGAGPVELDADTPWAEVEQDDRAEACTATAFDVPASEAGWALGVRFTAEPW